MATLNKILSFVLLLVSANAELHETTNLTVTKVSDSYQFALGSNNAESHDSFFFASFKDKFLTNQTKSIHYLDLELTIYTPNQRSKDNEKKCNITLLGTENKNNSVLALRNLRRFGNNKVLVSWIEFIDKRHFFPNYDRINIIDLLDCKISPNSVKLISDLGISFTGPVVYKNSFDIIIKDYDTCGSYKPCKISYDENGKQIDKSDFLKADLWTVQIFPIDSNSLSKGFYERKTNPQRIIEINYVSPAGNKTNVLTESMDYRGSELFKYPISTNVNEFYGICYPNGLDLHCKQFDKDGNLRINASIQLREKEELLGIHNLADNGMLLFTKIPDDDKHDYQLEIRVIDNKTQGKPVKLDFYFYEDRKWIFYQNVVETDDELILYLETIGNKYRSYEIDYFEKGYELVDSKIILSKQHVLKKNVLSTD